jgi:hypothetical protein
MGIPFPNVVPVPADLLDTYLTTEPSSNVMEPSFPTNDPIPDTAALDALFLQPVPIEEQENADPHSRRLNKYGYPTHIFCEGYKFSFKDCRKLKKHKATDVAYYSCSNGQCSTTLRYYKICSKKYELVHGKASHTCTELHLKKRPKALEVEGIQDVYDQMHNECSRIAMECPGKAAKEIAENCLKKMQRIYSGISFLLFLQ